MKESNVQKSEEQALELSIQILINSWLRRKKWKNLFFLNRPDEQTSQWRTKLAEFLESKYVRAAAILLLLLDLVLTTLELTSSILSCSPSNNIGGEKRRENEQATWYHWLGIAILGLLFAKTVALAVALGGSLLLRRPGLMVDGVVLAVALVLEAFLEGKGGGLVAVVSLWRVVRVVESAFELSDDTIEAKIEEIVTKLEGLREENSWLLVVVDEKDKVIQKFSLDLDLCRDHKSILLH